jgi:septal ring factor EnvC (AmiA/AmiB activator)
MAHHYDDGPDIAATNEKIRKKQEEIQRLEKEKEALIKEEEVKNKEALELSKTLQKLKEVRHKTDLAIIETQEKLYKLCTHEKVKTKSHTIPGGYLNQREYVTEYYCELCGVLVDKKVKYGGFE